MKRLPRFSLHLFLLLCLVISAVARPRPVPPPWPEQVLASCHFDELLLAGTNFSLAELAAAHRAESWSGCALTRNGESAPPVWLSAVDATGRTNLALGTGALRFWFRPDWTSGEGLRAGSFPRLLELARATAGGLEVLWSLHLDADGSTLYLTQVDSRRAEDLLSAPVAWRAGEWHLVTLVWRPTGAALYLDGALADLGGGVTLPAGVGPVTVGIALGSDVTGGNLAQGQFEEVTSLRTFDPVRQSYYYASRSKVAARGPITPEEDAARDLQRKQLLSARAAASLAAGAYGPLDFDGPDPCPTNGPVYMTNLFCSYATNTGWTMQFDVVGGTNGVLYDAFTAAALAGTNVAQAQWFWVTNTLTCSTVILTNQLTNGTFYILGLTNDSDGGGLSDAYEQLVTGGNINNPADDWRVPWVSLEVTDSVAVERQPTNTARFLLTRLGGFMKQSLTVPLLVSGSASNNGDYTLSNATTTATNLLVTFPAGQNNAEVILTPQNDSVAEGTETATLTLTTNTALWTVDLTRRSATAWILEEYSRTYTWTNDFKLGVMSGLETEMGSGNGQLQFQTNLPSQFPFINVACSDVEMTSGNVPGRGTVVRINTTNGAVVGEYRTAPHGLPNSANPSRTTVDQYGNVWVANRDDTRAINGTNYGSITRIGLVLGTRYAKSTNGVYYASTNGPYFCLSNATYNTCIDRDGDGFIRTSRGLADILPWNNGRGEDSDGGVSTATDEAITEYTRVPCTGTRTIAVDKFNDIWVGGHTGDRVHAKVNGLIGLTVPNSSFIPTKDAGTLNGGYGGIIDRLGNLWSSGSSDDSGNLLWLRATTNLPPQSDTDWQVLEPGLGTEDRNAYGYGIAVDPLHPYIWQTTGGADVFRWRTNGMPVTNANGRVILHSHGWGGSQGLTVDARGHVWVAHHKGIGNVTVGHLDTNGFLIGNVELRQLGLRGVYFGNTNLASPSARTNVEGPLDFAWTNGWPVAVATNQFSVRWTGFLRAKWEGDHVFYLNLNAGAGVRLLVDGVGIDYWNNNDSTPIELSTTNLLYTNFFHTIQLEYKNSAPTPWLTLSWVEPGTTNRTVIPRSRLLASDHYHGPTGVSVDSAGKIWATCFDSSVAVRIDPDEGDAVANGGVTNHVGAVDMVVDLGDGCGHQSPYDKPATPYNYSDMTGFNNRIVNPAQQPLKGYWVVVDDSGNAGQLWNKVLWTAALTNGCSLEVYVRAADERAWLGSEVFVAVANDVAFPPIRGRYIEVRLGLTRDDPAKQPVVYDLTLYGVSSGFIGDYFLEDEWALEGTNATFGVNLIGAEPMSYQWFRLYPWETNWMQVAGATSSTFTITNVDSWVDWTLVSCLVSNGNGESLWLGPAYLDVWPVAISVPNSGSSGAASRYPATINVFGQPTNLNNVVVSLWGLNHTRSADLSVLLVSPSDKRIMLMSNVGGANGVSNASLQFERGRPFPPSSDPISSGATSYYSPYNLGQETQVPGAPSGPYSIQLEDMIGDDPNGTWKLYIYDDQSPGGIGQLQGSWSLNLTF